MNKTEKIFTDIVRCEHCNTHAQMEILYTHSEIKNIPDEENDNEYDAGDVYYLQLCPACKALSLIKYFYFEGIPEDLVILFPSHNKVPLGLPEQLRKGYVAAAKIKNIDSNAYAVLIGRVLEMVCLDRGAAGVSLHEKISDLAKQGEIPDKLVAVANNLKKLRNVGAHASIGELEASDAPILEDLAKAILEYVYTAPYLASQAEIHLRRISLKKTKK